MGLVSLNSCYTYLFTVGGREREEGGGKSLRLLVHGYDQWDNLQARVLILHYRSRESNSGRYSGLVVIAFTC